MKAFFLIEMADNTSNMSIFFSSPYIDITLAGDKWNSPFSEFESKNLR
jgi:hypothetical protein